LRPFGSKRAELERLRPFGSKRAELERDSLGGNQDETKSPVGKKRSLRLRLENRRRLNKAQAELGSVFGLLDL
jgi:hypothetical protein